MSQWWILGKGLVRMTMTDGKYMYTHPTHIHTHSPRLLCILLLWQHSSDSRANDGCLNLTEQRGRRGGETHTHRKIKQKVKHKQNYIQKNNQRY